MSAIQLWSVDPETIPTPGPGSVLLFVGQDGALSHKTETGAVVSATPGQGPQGEAGPQGDEGQQGPQGPQGLPGNALVDAMAIGAYAVLWPVNGTALNRVAGEIVTAASGNLQYGPSGNAANVNVPNGQQWRYMGGFAGNALAAFLFQRVA